VLGGKGVYRWFEERMGSQLDRVPLSQGEVRSCFQNRSGALGVLVKS
jgi:hypothetical protein